jgi:hypothetical protein
MNLGEIVDAISPVAAAFDHLNVPYYVTGSVASSALGVARSTRDIDVVAARRLLHAAPFTQRLSNDFYIDQGMIERRRSLPIREHLDSVQPLVSAEAAPKVRRQ